MNTTIGKRIRAFREEKGFSQEELAEKLHVSRSYQRIENGETNSWINHIENICASLDVELDDILKPEEGFTQINRNNEQTNDNNASGMIQNQTNHYHTSDKLLESLHDHIALLKEENQRLKEENHLLKSQK